jgi:glycosyltransferase involved in cell wall biosynthesis
VPSIALVADMLHRELPEYLKPEVVVHRENYLSPIIRDATLIQCISLSAENRLQHHYPETRGKTFVTYLPIQSRLQNVPLTAEQLTVPHKKYFLYPANFWPHKNHRLLLTAFRDFVLHAGAAAWDLVLCGSDYDGNAGQISELADSMSLGGRVHLPGYVDEAMLARLWRQASALIFPSLHEGFGIPLLEAMSMDIPVLSANGYSLPEVAGDAALFFDPRDASQITARMLEIMSDEDLRQSLIKRGRARLQVFDEKVEGAKLVDAFYRIRLS